MKNISGPVCLLVSLVVAGCATAPAKTFYPAGAYATWHFDPKASPADVQVLRAVPESGFGILGELALGGGPRNSFQEMLDLAQKEAAARGADFIVLTNQQVQTREETVPGIVTQQQSRNAVLSVNGSTGFGTASSQGTAFAVGPSVRSVQTGSMNFLVGKYPKVWLGLIIEMKRADRKIVISDFSWDSPAPKAGIQVGDELVAVDGRDVRDPESGKNIFFTARAGEIISVVIKRGGELKEFSMPYIDRFSKRN
jgi:predicted metalloprotease with PDZ domain